MKLPQGEFAGKKKTIEIAEMVFTLSSANPSHTVSFDESYRAFASQKKGQCRLSIHYRQPPKPLPLKNTLVFQRQLLWTLYRLNGAYALFFSYAPLLTFRYRIAYISEDFRAISVYAPLHKSNRGDPPLSLYPNPLEPQLFQISMILYLAQTGGAMLHACGVIDNGKGYLFVGDSEQGKSTTASLWHRKATILNDDRIIVRKKGGRFWMYGTPWHGDFNVVSRAGVPIEKIFCLTHAKTNSCYPIKGLAAHASLFTRCMLPIWDKDGIMRTSDLCAQLSKTIPVYRLGFVPDETAVEFVRNL